MSMEQHGEKKTFLNYISSKYCPSNIFCRSLQPYFNGLSNSMILQYPIPTPSLYPKDENFFLDKYPPR